LNAYICTTLVQEVSITISKLGYKTPFSKLHFKSCTI